MPTNDFQLFATAAGANVMTLSAYEALASRTTGYVKGIAQSVQLNRTWRQSSIITTMIAQFISDVLSVDSTDDGTIATLETNFELAIMRIVDSGHYAVDTGAVNAYVATLSPAVLSYYTGLRLFLKAASTNTSGATLNVNGQGAVPIRYFPNGTAVALLAGMITVGNVVELVYDGTQFVLSSPTYKVGGALTGFLPNPTLTASGVSAGTYVLPTVTVGTDGRITGITALPYTPVQQGTGVGQASNVVKIGWSTGGQALLTVDTTNIGPFAMANLPNTFTEETTFAAQWAGTYATLSVGLTANFVNATTGLTAGPATFNGIVTNETDVNVEGIFYANGSTSSFQRHLTIGTENSGDPVFILMDYLTHQVGSITTDGASTFFNTTSDYRVKTVYGPIDTGAVIDAIPVYDAAFTDGKHERRAMFLAHEIAEHIPGIVLGEKDAKDDEGKPVLQQIDQISMVPYMWAEIQSLRKVVKTLNAAVDDLRRSAKRFAD